MSDRPGLALLLAGGGSRRMQREKLLVDVGGASMLERTASWLAQRFARVVLAVDGRRDVFGGKWARWPDATPGRGPLPAVTAALERWGTAIFVCAADGVDAKESALEELCAAWSPDLGAVAFSGAAGPDPLFAIYGPAFLPRLQAASCEPNASLSRLLAESGARVLRAAAVPPDNVNRIEDLQRWRVRRRT